MGLPLLPSAAPGVFSGHGCWAGPRTFSHFQGPHCPFCTRGMDGGYSVRSLGQGGGAPTFSLVDI